MWFSYKDENTWHPITTARAAEVLEMNKEEELPESLAVDRVEVDLKDTKINSDLERMDARFKKKDYKKKYRNKLRNQRNGGKQEAKNSQSQNQKKQHPTAQIDKKGGENKKPNNRNRKNRFKRNKNKNEG